MFDKTPARDPKRDHMVDSQIRTADVTDLRLLQAFRHIAREPFVPKSKSALAYSDRHVEVDEGRVLLRPRDLAKMIQAVDIQASDIVLDVACGRGYSTAILAQMADTVIGLEISTDVVMHATDLLVEQDVSNAAIVEGALKSGASDHGPFNVIFINGAVSAVPKSWVSQLANGGRLVCILQDGPVGRATVFTKTGDVMGERVIFDTSAPYLEGFAPAPVFAL